DPEQLRYAALDAEVPVRLWDVLATEADAADLTATLGTEMIALLCVAWAAHHGVGFDRAAWEALAAEAEAKRTRLREQLDAMAPNSANLFKLTNWDSAAQVQAAFAALGVTLDSTDDDSLAAVDHPLASQVRDYRGAAKLATTYGRKWLKHAGPGDRVFATWKQIGAGASGRMSCKEPNLQ